MLKINFTGDLMLGRGIGEKVTTQGLDSVFGEMRDFFANDEHNICNLEAPFCTNGIPYWNKDSNITFSIEKQRIDTLKYLNIKTVLLGNNHITDYGQKGIIQSKDVLHQAGISYTGAGENIDEATTPVIIANSVLEVAIFSFCGYSIHAKPATKNDWGMAYFDYDTVINAIKSHARQRKVILCVHWGIDYYQYPVLRQLETAKRIIKECPQVICIIGHHPHLIQPRLDYLGVAIYLSLGNFAFDEPKVLSRRGMLVSLEIDVNGTVNHRKQFVRLTKDNTLEYLDEPELTEELVRLSDILNDIEQVTSSYLKVDDRWALTLLYSLFEKGHWHNIKILYRNYGLIGTVRVLIRKLTGR